MSIGMVIPAQVQAASSGSVNMYRLYNLTSGEHFYTSDSAERNNLTSIGWKYEGIGWVAPKSSNTPVYRLYNPNTGDHHYTTSQEEKASCVNFGWRYEGIGWYSDDSKRISLYREYNPSAITGSHNYTSDLNEHTLLTNSYGWVDEGIAWYGVSGAQKDNTYSPSKDELLNSVRTSSSGEFIGDPCYADFDNDGRLEIVQATWKSSGDGFDLRFWHSDGFSVKSFGEKKEQNSILWSVKPYVISMKDGTKHYAYTMGWRPGVLAAYVASSEAFSIKNGVTKNIFSMEHAEIQSVGPESIDITYGRQTNGELMWALFSGNTTVYFDGTRYPVPSDSIDAWLS